MSEEQFSAIQTRHNSWKGREAEQAARGGDAGVCEAPGRNTDPAGTSTPRVRGKPKVSNPDYHERIAGMCHAMRLPVPVPELKFHPTRGWLFDEAWPDYKVALEVEGGIWKKGGGAHSHPSNIQRDHEKYTEAGILGWCVLHVAPEDLMTKGLDYIVRALQARGVVWPAA